jgi:SepF-like predicted cell division protein (DUF552 family)
MTLTIKEIDTVHHIKGVYQKNQLKTVKCYILDKLQNGNPVMVNLSELQDERHEIVYMLQRLKMILANRRQLQYYTIAA